MAPPAETTKAAKPSRWKKVGGRALSISVVVHLILLIIGILWAWTVTPAGKPPPPDFIGRQDGGGGGSQVAAVKIQPTFRKAQAAPTFSSSDQKRIAANTNNSLILPDPESEILSAPLPALSAPSSRSAGGSGTGSGGGRGAGQGTGTGNGIGPGFGGHFISIPGARFFGQQAKAQRVAYVIDFSKSMNGKRQRLMREELVKSITGLEPTQEYELIFFAGPVWVAGSKVELAPDQKSGVVTTPEGREHRWTSKSVGEWQMSGSKQKTSWLANDQENLQRSIGFIRETPLVFGTDWKPALELALDMNPAPEVIYFMTDGIVTDKVYEIIDGLARTARHRKCVIHTIAMMEPEAAEAMRTLANKTGGSFTMIHQDGTTTNESQSP